VVEDVVTPAGPYRLALMARGGMWSSPLPEGRSASARQLSDGRIAIWATDEDGLLTARFQLGLRIDTGSFHNRFHDDRLLGPAARQFVGYRPIGVATVAHSVLRAFCGQLIEAHRAVSIERAILRLLGQQVATRDAIAAVAPVELRRCGLAQPRATALVLTARNLDLERLRSVPGHAADAVLDRQPGIGPWTLGVIALEGLGRLDRGLTGDLGLVKLMSSLEGRWVEPEETTALLAPYGEWQGLAGSLLMLGWKRGLVPGADPDAGRRIRIRASRAA
jgi:3-methyladenine DNA glycosylase/8-oxoguanine DNA glycosylase